MKVQVKLNLNQADIVVGSFLKLLFWEYKKKSLKIKTKVNQMRKFRFSVNFKVVFLFFYKLNNTYATTQINLKPKTH